MSLLDLIRRLKAVEPHDDYGFFGPGSVTWRVWAYPTSPVIAFSRAVVVEELDPFLVAPVTVSSKIYSQPRVRYDRTLRYFATVFFGDSRSVVKASEVLMKVHARAVSVEPVSGLRADPNNPDSQMWIHLTAWHSALYAYEKYGPGPLSAEDEARFWQECAVAAEFQTIDPDKVPRSREEVRDYFARMRPRLAATEATQAAMDHLLNADVVFPPMPAVLRPGAWVVAKLIRAAVIATLPRWQRDLAGLRQPRAVDTLIRPAMRLGSWAAALSPRLMVQIVGVISPATVAVAAPMLLGIPPRRPEVLTPSEAFERHGTPTPAELYEELQGGPDLTMVYTPSAPVPADDAAPVPEPAAAAGGA